VLRDIAAGTGVVAPVESAVFEGDSTSERLGASLEAARTALSVRTRVLPGLRPSAADPAANAIVAASVMADPRARLTLLEQASTSYPDSLELPYCLVGAHIEAGSGQAEVTSLLEKAEASDPGDWRGTWFRGQAALAQGDGPGAVAAFEDVLSELPGELAPKLALGLAYELAGNLSAAEAYFNLVSTADTSYTTAAFGLARCRRSAGDRDGAVEALERVPIASNRYESARQAMVEVLLDQRPAPPGQSELHRAGEILDELRAGDTRSASLHRLAARLLVAAARLVERRSQEVPAEAGPPGQLLGLPLRGKALRAGAEKELRLSARLAASTMEKIAFIDQANRVRPFTIV
jgi:serine/threonine-protein kinase PknG